MKLIIDIPKKDWEFIKEADGCRWSRAILDGVINGTPLEEELEKIKEDILNLSFIGWADKPKLDREEVLTILDKYTSELSGDNKQIRCNNCQNNTDELSGECYECVKGIKDNYISKLKGE